MPRWGCFGSATEWRQATPASSIRPVGGAGCYRASVLAMSVWVPQTRTVNSYVAWQRATIADPGEGRVLRILELYVHPDGRGQRMGSGLLARAIDAARQRECRAVVLASNISEAYWPWPNRSGSCFRGMHCSSHSNASSGQTGGVGGAGSGTGTGTGRSVVHVSHAGFVPAVGATNGLAVGASRMPP